MTTADKDRIHNAVQRAIQDIDDHAFEMVDREIALASTVQEIEAIVLHNVGMLAKIGTDEKLWRIYLVNIGSQIARCIAGIDMRQHAPETAAAEQCPECRMLNGIHAMECQSQNVEA